MGNQGQGRAIQRHRQHWTQDKDQRQTKQNKKTQHRTLKRLATRTPSQ